jgi:PAS domain S-box-containing protein
MKAPSILVVEDNPITRKLVRVALGTEGYAVREAPDGHTALELMTQEPPDLILQDLRLPDVDGLDLVQRLRSLPGGTAVPILAVSGFLSQMEQARTNKAGFTDYLFKPVEPSRLLDTVRTYLAPVSTGEGGGAGWHVLVADDEPIQRKLLRVQLESLGFHVTTAEDGEDALEKARREPPDAIVSDVLMPRLDGFQLCKAVRQDQRLSHVPVLLTSAVFTEEADRQLARAMGGTQYVLRSPDNKEVIAGLMAALQPGLVPEPVPPAEVPAEAYTHRIIRQLERQVALNSSLTNRVGLLETELAILAGFAEAVDSGQALEAVLDRLLNRCLDAAGISRGAAYLVEPGQPLRLAAQAGQAAEATEELRCFYGRLPLLERVLDEGEPLVVPSDRLPAEEAAALLAKAQLSSLLITPLAGAGERLGVLVMGSSLPEEARKEWGLFSRVVGGQIGQTLVLARTVSGLRASEQRYRLLADNATDMISRHTPDGVFVYVSPACRALLGWKPEELLGKSGYTLLHPDDLALVRQGVTAVFERAGPAPAVSRLRRKDGGFIWVEMTTHRLEGASGEVVCVTRDVTTRKRLEEQFLQAQKMEAVGRLAGGIAHDFNNLLTVIISYSEMALAGLPQDQPVRPFIQEVRKAGEQAAKVTRQLLAYSRKQVLRLEVLDLNDMVGETQPLLERLLGAGINLVAILDPRLGRVAADLGQTTQVLFNLVVNARDAMAAGGDLVIETRNVDLTEADRWADADFRPGRYVLLSVTDTGTGMDEEVQAHLFEPFFTTKEVGKGTGLGLSTVYGIVKQSGGQIDVQSRPGEGTTVRVYFPRIEGVPAGKAAKGGKPAAGHGTETILLVEDDEGLRELGRLILTASGYRVLTARDGNEALQLCEGLTAPLHLLLTDVVMPHLSGRQLVDQLLLKRPGLKVLFLSGYSPDTLKSHGVGESAPPFLQKPFTPTTLTRIVREVLDGRR